MPIPPFLVQKHVADQAPQAPSPPVNVPPTQNLPAPQAAVLPDGQQIALQVPRTPAELDALRQRGNELSGQLISARTRRDRLVNQLRRGDPDEAGVRQQVQYLDNRILSLEQAIDLNGKLIAGATPGAYAGQNVFGPPFTTRRMEVTPVLIVFILFVLAPAAFAFVWRSLKKPTPAALPQGWNEHLQRVERVEQAVDTIAIEIERISEGQRFLTKTLAERGDVATPKALGAGAAEPISQAKARDAVPVGERKI